MDFQLKFEPNPEQRRRIVAATSSFFEQIFFGIDEGKLTTIEECIEAVTECSWNECTIIGLDLRDQLDLAQEFGPDLGLELHAGGLENLRSEIERIATAVIHHLAEQRAVEHLEELQDLMMEHGLTLRNLRLEDPHGCFAHQSERYPKPGVVVYEYRGLEESDQAVDVWQVDLGEAWRVYFWVGREATR